MTFLSCFLIVAIILKFSRIDFSSPQLFLGFVIITALVEAFFYTRRHAIPQDIAIVPGDRSPTRLPKRTLGPIKFTQLVSCPQRQIPITMALLPISAPISSRRGNAFLPTLLSRVSQSIMRKISMSSITGRVAVEHLRENTFGGLIPALIYPQFKRVLDFCGALLALPLVAFIIGISAIFIKLETPGPILFQQLRIGLGGRPFTILKLRTMTDDHDGDAYTRPDDDRITRVGRVLRQYRIDELPQIINILRGEMSWIGPRPEASLLPSGTNVKCHSMSIDTSYDPASVVGPRYTREM